MSDSDPFDLQRFVNAQAPLFDTALGELERGCKTSHWMWFIFPQLRGLGLSWMADHYGIGSLDEARAYLAHPLLGPRLARCTRAVLGVQGRTLLAIFGEPDDVKFVSSMTLFWRAAAPGPSVYRDAINQCCDGKPDDRTLALLGLTPGP